MAEVATIGGGAIVHTDDGRDCASTGNDGFCRIRRANPNPGNASRSAAGVTPPGQKWKASLAVVGRDDLHAIRSLLRAAWLKASHTWRWPPPVYQRCGAEETY
jgi:hypothetical protein